MKQCMESRPAFSCSKTLSTVALKASRVCFFGRWFRAGPWVKWQKSQAGRGHPRLLAKKTQGWHFPLRCFASFTPSAPSPFTFEVGRAMSKGVLATPVTEEKSGFHPTGKTSPGHHDLLRGRTSSCHRRQRKLSNICRSSWIILPCLHVWCVFLICYKTSCFCTQNISNHPLLLQLFVFQPWNTPTHPPGHQHR